MAEVTPFSLFLTRCELEIAEVSRMISVVLFSKAAIAEEPRQVSIIILQICPQTRAVLPKTCFTVDEAFLTFLLEFNTFVIHESTRVNSLAWPTRPSK
jgi:hypothetical protein